MREVQRYLDSKSAHYGRLPLFNFLRDSTINPRDRLAFVPALAHFVMTFADIYAVVLREEPPRDRFQELVNAHTYEDGGHWKWYLADLASLELDPVSRYSDFLKAIWGESTAKTRLLSYRICRLGLGADSMSKLVLVQCIEAAGKVSLEAAAPVGQELGRHLGKNLVYFGPHHFDTESEHTLEDATVHKWLEDLELDSERRARMRWIIDEAFQAFTEFSKELMNFTTQPPSSARNRTHEPIS